MSEGREQDHSSDPIASLAQVPGLLEDVASRVSDYIDSLGGLDVVSAEAETPLDGIGGPLPEVGYGARESIERLMAAGIAAGVHSAGPRYFHFVTGGATPAALAADWVAAGLDQNAAAWECSPFATELETVTLGWLKELFGIPGDYDGILVTSATMANYTALSCARHWWAERYGVDVTSAGLAGLANMPVLTSGYVHVSIRKAVQMLGCGRNAVQTFSCDDAGRLDLDRMAAVLKDLGGRAIIVGTAGEVNAGGFDPISQLANLAEDFGAWLHIDGAFGLFAALSPQTAHLVDGVARADSVIADGHKWLNVPYDSAFAFIRDRGRLAKTFGAPQVAYLPGLADPHVNYEDLGPDASRRARALPIWATLRAYGRSGYREMVERHLDLARQLGSLIETDCDLQLLAPVQLCNVCFRFCPAGMDDEEADRVNAEIGRRLEGDGRVLAGTTTYHGRKALRPAIVNWRSTRRDVVLLAEVVKEIGHVVSGMTPGAGRITPLAD